ncbi:5416_t:CDS:2 [Funneliformis caledonium]|uniref:5416_t:CDS:1 n=1 Tax=Funneliformis caledonium TaxID=1117310 RepID=A0A9N9C4N4_9GLOM|nr:5416_t:CDS:2 [Funneliformis caledonium]
MSETSFSSKLVNVLFGVPFIILIFACPIFEILKLEYFNRTNVLIYDTNVEYTYLVLSLIAPSVLILIYVCKCNYAEYVSKTTIKIALLVFLLSWIGIASAYTVFTIHELGDIPFTCPKDFNYSAPQVQSACQIRAVNLVIMWTFAFFLIMNILSYFIGMNSLNEKSGGKIVDRSIPEIRYYEKEVDIPQRFVSPKSTPPIPSIIQPPLGTDSKDGEQHQFSKIELGEQQPEGDVSVPAEQVPVPSPGGSGDSSPSLGVRNELSRTSSIRKSVRRKAGSSRRKKGSDIGSSDEGKSK